MGLMDSVFGNSAAKNAAKVAQYRGTNINAPGFGGITVDMTKKGPQNIGFTLDPFQQQLGTMGNALTGMSLDRLMQGSQQGFGAGGYYGLGMQYDPFVSSAFAMPGASGAFLDPSRAMMFQNLGLGMLGTDYGDVANQQTNLLRQQSRPYEDLATTRALDRLMSRGQLGISTPLNDTFRALNDQFGQQDLAFQLAGLERADSLRNADRATGMSMLGMGTEQGLQQQNQLLQALQSLGQTGINAAGTAGQLGTQNFGQILGMLGAGQGINQQQFQNLMSLLSGSVSASSARSGANANAGTLAAQNNPAGTLWDLAGSAIGGWAAGKAK